jgi:hypothetical protein
VPKAMAEDAPGPKWPMAGDESTSSLVLYWQARPPPGVGWPALPVEDRIRRWPPLVYCVP